MTPLVVTDPERRRSRTASMTAISVARPAPDLSWRTLLRVAAGGQAVGLAVAAVVLGDAEAGAIAAVTLGGAFLQRFRPTAGAVVLGLLFADTAFFMAAATVSNLLDRAAPGSTIGPAILAATALAGLLAAATTVGLRGRTASASRGAMAAALVVLLALAVVAVMSLASSRGAAGGANDVLRRPEPGPEPVRLRLEISGARYSVDALTASRGTVTISVTNHDLFWHTFTIGELGVDLRVPVGDEKSVTFSAAPGEYTYICGVPGHASFMRGVLTVR